jgi:hypothetical protein
MISFYTQYICAQKLSLAHTEYARNYFLFILSLRRIAFRLYSVCAEVCLASVCGTKFNLY